MRVLDHEYESLLDIDCDLERVRIYNENANQLREEIVTLQKNLSNPWISSFVCYVYREFDASEIKNITFTVSTSVVE